MPVTQHNRLTEKLRTYWESICSGRPYPEENDIDISVIADIWDSCFLVKAVNTANGRVFRYDYLGKDLIDAFGGDVTNQEISEKLVNPSHPPLQRSFGKVMDTGKPAEEESEFTNSAHMIIKCRSCMLPLGTKDGVNYIVGGMKWKSF